MLQVHAGWVVDTDVFNEWMNEEDYCVNERNVSIILRRRIHLHEELVCVKLLVLVGLTKAKQMFCANKVPVTWKML